MTNKIIIIFVIGISISSCTFSQKTSDEKTNDNISNKGKYVIPDSLFSFFPDKSSKYKGLKMIKFFENAQQSENSLTLLEFDPTKIIKAYQCGNKEILQQLIEEYRSQSMFSIKTESNDYFVMGSAWELSKKYDTLELKEQFIKLNDVPLVFNFRESFYDIPLLYDATTISGLPVGYEMLILKSGNSIVLPQNQLSEWSVLPNNLKHGYRSGVAFKEDTPYIIYWIVAW